MSSHPLLLIFTCIPGLLRQSPDPISLLKGSFTLDDSEPISQFGSASKLGEESKSTILPDTPVGATRHIDRSSFGDGPAVRRSILGASMLTRSVGTRMYASPEQLESSNYNYKSDIYSLGLVLFRLFNPIYTQMETILVMEKAREGNFKDGFINYFAKLGELIKKCTSLEPKERPELGEIETGILQDELRLFSILKYNHKQALDELFQSKSDNLLCLGMSTNIMQVIVTVEGEEKPIKGCRVLLRNSEALIILPEKHKAKYSLALKDFTIITGRKRKVVSLTSNIKEDMNLYFSSLDDLELFTNICADFGCILY